MSHRFVRCPHCKMPHDAAERVCPNTGLVLPTDSRTSSKRAGERPKPAPRVAPVPSIVVSGDSPPGLVGQTIGGRYRIKSVLGEGGMGTVFDAEHLGLSRDVAIKVLSPAQTKKRVAVKRFQQEARAAGAIGHPNICEVYDLGLLDDGSPYLVMEKLVGNTLAERIAKEGGLPFEDVVDVVSQVLSGLVAAHEKGIVHRDIKPENIFLARRLGCPPIVKLLDFGVSKMMSEFQTSDDALDLTRTGMVMGTPYYMSPEQARGERNLDGRVDVYASGIVMYEALSGRRPFLAPNYNALLLAIISTTPKPLRELRAETPAALEAIISRAMSKDRDERYLSARAFLRDLKPATSASEASASRVPLPPTPEERKRAPVLGGGRARPEDSTRVDLKVNLTPSGSSIASIAGADRPDLRLPPLVESMVDSERAISIPIHFGHSVGEHIEAPGSDDPTQIFQPAQLAPPQGRSAPSVNLPVDEWDGETVVTRPEPSPGSPDPKAPQRDRPFNPEETVNLDGAHDIEMLDNASPRRPRPRRR